MEEDWDDSAPTNVSAPANNNGTKFGRGRGFHSKQKDNYSNENSGNSSGLGTLDNSNDDRRPGGSFRGGHSKGPGRFNNSGDNGFGNNRNEVKKDDDEWDDDSDNRGNKGFGDNNGQSSGFGSNRGFGDDNGGQSRGFGSNNRGFGNDNGGQSRGFGSNNRGFGDDNEGQSRGFGDDDQGNRENRRGGYGGGRGRGSRGGRGGGFGNRDRDNDNGGGGDRGFNGNRGFGDNNDNDGNEGSGFGGGRGGGRGRGRGRGGGGDRGDRGDRDGGDGGDRREKQNSDQPEKPREIYIPVERSEDDLYDSGVKAGINFSKYDDIEVKVSGDDVPAFINSFEEANLREIIADNVKRSNYNVPTPIQKYAIPIIMADRDLIGCSQTGSGKTAAFLLPIIHKLLEESRDYSDMSSHNCVEPRALIMAPTRELASQIYDEARKFAKNSILKIHIVYGGASVGHQTKRIFTGCDILVATPGRLLDMVGRGKIVFQSIQYVVLDEADRMLDMGFQADIEKILRHETMVPTGERRTLMFSATFPSQVQELARKYLNNYVFVVVGIIGAACADVEQIFLEVKKTDKLDKIVELLGIEMNNNTINGTLIFVKEKSGADFLASFLAEKRFSTTSIHGDRLQREREEAINDFKSERRSILVGTAVAARGLDMCNVSHVINYDLPDNIVEYIHKIGRTGRCGNKGKATSFYDGRMDRNLQGDLVRILREVGQEVPAWLETGAGDGSYEASKFGAEDIRSFSDVQSSSKGAAQPVEEDDDWS